MANCNLTAGRYETCKESIGGLKGVYFISPFASGSDAFGKGGGSATADDLITALPESSSLYYYELKGTSAYTETVNSSRDTGTTFYSQELTLNLKKLTNKMTTQLKLLAKGRPQVVVWTNNGDALLCGEVRGMDLTAGTIQTGAGLGDLYGYSITLTGEEKNPASFISGSTQQQALNTAVLNGSTIVVDGED